MSGRLASDEWNLRIEYVQKRDAGIYECQVNTEPKINMAILLAVEEKTSEILDSSPGASPTLKNSKQGGQFEKKT
ncbi:SFRICE_030321 [Gryllus bimaculatus]|nr:SFRICE_030321 [Gryllus bimaculatus]